MGLGPLPHMQVLIVDAFAPTSKGRAGFDSFRRVVTQTLSGSWNEKHDIIVRKIDSLEDYVCDWEHDVLDENSKKHCAKFDKLDVICLGGDMKVCPWDPLFTKAISLLIWHIDVISRYSEQVLVGSLACTVQPRKVRSALILALEDERHPLHPPFLFLPSSWQ